MQTTLRVAADHKSVKLLDAVVLFWVTVWVVLGDLDRRDPVERRRRR